MVVSSMVSLDSCVKLIVEGSIKLNCSTITLSKALLLYHNFKRVHEINCDYIVAAACLSISIKFHGEDVEFDAIIVAFYSIMGIPLTTTRDKNISSMEKSLIEVESIILRVNEFYLNHHLAHEFLAYYLNDIRDSVIEAEFWAFLTSSAVKLANDFYLFHNCIEYKPEDIALTVLKAAFQLVGFESDEVLNTWLQALNKVPESTISDIITDLFEICSVRKFAEDCKMKTAIKI